MRKLLIGLCLSLVATVASAEWVLVTRTADGNKHFADPSTKRRVGTIVRIWEISDYGKPRSAGGDVYLSDRNYWQYDCVERTRQYLQATVFAGKMATGEMVFSFNLPGNKEFVAPNTVAEHLFNFACK